MNEPYSTLIQAAVSSPSGDNTQPWRFRVDENECAIDLIVDPTRDPSPMNAGQRMARIAVGAALESMLQTAVHNSWSYTLRAGGNGVLATVVLENPVNQPGQVDPVVLSRTTNRRTYDGRSLSAECLRRIVERTAEFDGVRTFWITAPDAKEKLAGLVGRADALMFSAKEIRQAFLDNVRFDVPDCAEVKIGLPLGSLELSAFQRFGLKRMSSTPDVLLKWGGGLRALGAAARALLRSAAGVCLITSTGDNQVSEMNVGRAMQRAWLDLAAERLAVQPMMSLPVLQNVRDNAAPELFAKFGRPKTESLLAEFYQLVSQFGDGRPMALMRFGYAPPPSVRTGRLPIHDVAVNASTASHAE